MNGLEDDVFTTAVKEAACMAFAGTQADGLSPISAHLSFVFSAASETVSIALCCYYL
jgi:hypothetical protein